MCSRISFLMEKGMMGWSAITMRPFHVLNLFLPVKRSHTGSLTSSLWTCQPLAVYGRDIVKLRSSFVPCLMSSSLSSDSGHDEVTALTCRLTSSSMSLQSDLCRGLLDRASTTSMPFAVSQYVVRHFCLQAHQLDLHRSTLLLCQNSQH